MSNLTDTLTALGLESEAVERLQRNLAAVSKNRDVMSGPHITTFTLADAALLDLAAKLKAVCEERDAALDAATDAYNSLQTFTTTGNEGFVGDAMRILDEATQPHPEEDGR